MFVIYCSSKKRKKKLKDSSIVKIFKILTLYLFIQMYVKI